MFDMTFYKGKRVLITGHTGFKGSWLCEVLVKYGAYVIGYSLQPPTEPSLYRLAGIEKEIVSVIGDIRDLKSYIVCLKNIIQKLYFILRHSPLYEKVIKILYTHMRQM